MRPLNASQISELTPEQLAAYNAALDDQIRQASKDDFMLFVERIRIASQGQDEDSEILGNVMADFQRKCFEEMAPSLEALRQKKMPEKRRWWIERTKKASKDADLAVILMWLIAFPVKPFYAQVGAGNREQAAIVKERLTVLLHHNPWLNEYVEVVETRIRSKKTMVNGSPMAHADIMAADAKGAHGGTPDLLIVNELSHVKDWEFVQTLLDNADGVARGMVIIATNAGKKSGDKNSPWGWRKNAMEVESDWVCHFLSEPAPWHTDKVLNDARARSPDGSFKRLWWGVWESPGGSLLSEETVKGAFRLKGPLKGPEQGWLYIMGMDLGVKRDHSAVVTLGVHTGERRIKLAQMKRWAPRTTTGKVNLQEVEEYSLATWRKFHPLCLVYDPSQAELLTQNLQTSGVFTKEMSFSSGKSLSDMANTFIQVMQEGILECYDELDEKGVGILERDFFKFHIEEKPYGTKLEATRDEHGHADLGTALVIALPAAVSLLSGAWNPEIDGDLISMNNNLTKEEIAELPKDLKDLIELEDDVAKEDEDYSNYF